MKILLYSLTLLVGMALGGFTNQFDKGYQVGDYADDFSLMNIDETLVSLSDFKAAKGFIITFTCNTCPYAVAYEDRIIALDKKYKEKTTLGVRTHHRTRKNTYRLENSRTRKIEIPSQISNNMSHPHPVTSLKPHL